MERNDQLEEDASGKWRFWCPVQGRSIGPFSTTAAATTCQQWHIKAALKPGKVLAFKRKV